MRKKFIISIIFMACVGVLGACGGNSYKKSEKETKAAQVVTVTTAAEETEEQLQLTGAASLKSALNQRIGRWIEIDGTAGASLKTLHQAVMMLRLADVGDFTLDIVSPVVLEYYSSLSTADQESFLNVWSGVDYYTDTILNDFYSISGMLEDAGDLDTAKTLMNSPTIGDKWEIMRRGISAVLPEVKREPASESDESYSRGNITEDETDENGYYIVRETDQFGNVKIRKTDADGHYIAETDEDGNILELETADGSKYALETDQDGRIITRETDEDGNRIVRETDKYGNIIKDEDDETSETIETLPVETTEAATGVGYPTTGAAETYVVESTTETYPTGKSGTDTFTNVVIISVDEKLDPSELSYFVTKYNLRLIYDYQNYNMYAFACEGATTQEQLDYIMKLISTENHVTGITQDKTLQLQ